MVAAEMPFFFMLLIQARTCSGRMSILRMAPNSGMTCLEIE
nr:hypothetical protein [Actinomadura sp. J1-007]